ncbi:MAG: HAMP domain-containing protein [Candidatus Eisenbacteria bacterium]|nr:HAMP domain-containing protein [Candidatus Eisenbacteria bacterium]
MSSARNSVRRRLGLGSVLILVNVGLVAGAVLVVTAGGSQVLRRLADEQALSRVETAGGSALRAVEYAEIDVLTSTRLLAQRPTLLQLYHSSDRKGLVAFLSQFGETGNLAGCALVDSSGIVASAGAALDWNAILLAAGSKEQVLLQPEPHQPLIAGAVIPVRDGDNAAAAVAARWLDEEFAQIVAAQVGVEIAIIPRDVMPSGLRNVACQRALATGNSTQQYIADEDAYLAILPLHSPSGNIPGVVAAHLSARGVAASIRTLARSLFLLALFVALLAAAVSVLVGRRLARPLRVLTAAAARIGRGDLETPIQRESGAEIGTLSGTMEEMRHRLVALTAELRQRRAEAEAVLGGIVEGVFTVDRERKIRYVNPQGAELMGLRPEDIIGRFCGDVLDPEPIDGKRPCTDRCPIVHARFRGTVRATEHLWLRRGERQQTVVITSAMPSPAGADPSEVLQFQMIRDETEVEVTRRLRDTVLANISHEFRTPLSAQLASIELLRDRIAREPGANLEPLVRSLEQGTLRLTWLIDNLLESVRIDAGQKAIRRQSVTLDTVVEDALSMTAPLITQRGQILESELPFPLPPIMGDPPRLVQVFVNLLANASKFAPADSKIRIGGRVHADQIQLWIDDEGTGFPHGDGDMVFERFVRSSGSEPEESGIGLGLWIVKSIVTRHGGRVTVEPTPGAASGSRFSVYLPISDTPTVEP